MHLASVTLLHHLLLKKREAEALERQNLRGDHYLLAKQIASITLHNMLTLRLSASWQRYETS